MKETPILQIVESDISQVKLDERVQLAIDSDSFSEYQMKCEVHGVEPKNESEWWVDHCGGFTIEFDAPNSVLMDLCAPQKTTVKFKSELGDPRVIDTFNNWMRKQLQK